jgi:hypothetical protein
MERLGEQVISVHTRDQTQVTTHRGLLIDKLDIPIGRVATGEEVPTLEKRLTRLRNGNKKGVPKWSASANYFLSIPPGRRGRPNQVDTHIGLRQPEIGLPRDRRRARRGGA